MRVLIFLSNALLSCYILSFSNAVVIFKREALFPGGQHQNSLPGLGAYGNLENTNHGSPGGKSNGFGWSVEVDLTKSIGNSLASSNNYKKYTNGEKASSEQKPEPSPATYSSFKSNEEVLPVFKLKQSKPVAVYEPPSEPYVENDIPAQSGTYKLPSRYFTTPSPYLNYKSPPKPWQSFQFPSKSMPFRSKGSW